MCGRGRGSWIWRSTEPHQHVTQPTRRVSTPQTPPIDCSYAFHGSLFFTALISNTPAATPHPLQCPAHLHTPPSLPRLHSGTVTRASPSPPSCLRELPAVQALAANALHPPPRHPLSPSAVFLPTHDFGPPLSRPPCPCCNPQRISLARPIHPPSSPIAAATSRRKDATTPSFRGPHTSP